MAATPWRTRTAVFAVLAALSLEAPAFEPSDVARLLGGPPGEQDLAEARIVDPKAVPIVDAAAGTPARLDEPVRSSAARPATVMAAMKPVLVSPTPPKRTPVNLRRTSADRSGIGRV